MRCRRSLTTLLLGIALTAAMPAAAADAAAWPSGRVAGCAVELESALTEFDRAAVAAHDTATSSTRASTAVTCIDTASRDAATPPLVASAARSSVRDVRTALATDDELARSVARGAATASLRVLAARATLAAVEAGDTDAARAWLVLRERRPATRIGVPEAPALRAVTDLAEGTLTRAETIQTVHDDLLGTSRVVLQARVDEIERQLDDGLMEGARVNAAAAAAAWQLFAGEASSPPAASKAAQRLGTLAFNPRVDATMLAQATATFQDTVRGVAGAELTEQVAAETAGKLARFVELVPVEYGRGVRDGTVTTQLEIQEARSFLRGAFDAWTALQPTVVERDRDAAEPVEDALTALDSLVTQAELTPTDAPAADDVERAATSVHSALHAAVPDSWLESSSTADLALVRSALTNLQTSARREDWRAAEQARVEAYGAFEFGPELRLRAIDPGLAIEVEELIWFGDSAHTGLAQLIAGHTAESDMTPTLAELDTKLDEVQDRLGTTATPGAIRTNSAIIVIREGMEAVLILAALTAGLAGAASSRWRRGILIGAILAFIATTITFVLAEALLDSLARFGERLEVVVSLVAIGVLLLILNWFVHKAYWTGWMAGFQKKKVSLTGTARERREQEQAAAASAADAVDTRRASAVAQLGGLILLGFTSIYREGFETVLFLQALVLDAGSLPVLEGAAIGLVAVAGLAVLTIGLQRRMPYRRMLIVTGVLIAVVLASMVGGTVQAMQAVGWMSVHPITGLHVPAWLSTWLGVHPTWEAVTLQFASIVFVMGSYVVAEWWQERQRTRRRTARRVTEAPQFTG